MFFLCPIPPQPKERKGGRANPANGEGRERCGCLADGWRDSDCLVVNRENGVTIFQKHRQRYSHYAEDSEMQNLTEITGKKWTAELAEMGNARRRELAEAGDLVVEHNLMKKSAAEPKSKAKAIHAFCFNCMGGTIDQLPDGGWKDLIRTCTAPGCPLYPHRPYRERRS